MIPVHFTFFSNYTNVQTKNVLDYAFTWYVNASREKVVEEIPDNLFDVYTTILCCVS